MNVFIGILDPTMIESKVKHSGDKSDITYFPFLYPECCCLARNVHSRAG